MTSSSGLILSALLLATATPLAPAAPGESGVKYDRLRSEGKLKRLATYARIYAIRNNKTLPPDLQAAVKLNQAPDAEKLVVDPWGNGVRYHAAGRTYESKGDPRVVVTAGPDPTGRFLAVDIGGNAQWLGRADVDKRVRAAKADGAGKGANETDPKHEHGHKHDHGQPHAEKDRPATPADRDERFKRSRAKTSLSRLRAYVTGHALRNGKKLPATMDVAVRDKRNGRELLVSPWGTPIRYYGAGRRHDAFGDLGPLLASGPNSDGKFLVMQINGDRDWVSEDELNQRLAKHRIRK